MVEAAWKQPRSCVKALSTTPNIFSTTPTPPYRNEGLQPFPKPFSNRWQRA